MNGLIAYETAELSILYLRCHKLIALAVALLNETFNSLFEMHDSLTGFLQYPSDFFQFSI